VGRVKARNWATCLLVTAAFASAAEARPKKAPDASAQPAPEAQQRFQRALDLYEEGNLDAARAELQRAYELAPNFKLLFNLGQVAFELHDYPAALAAFEKYLADGGPKVPDARRAQVEADIEKLKARVARVEVAADVAKADVFVDDVQMGSTPLPRPLVVSAGRRKITVTKSGYLAVTRWVDLAGGDTSQINVELAEPPANRLAPPPAPVAYDAAVTPTVPVSDVVRAPGAPASERPHGAGALWAGWALAGSLAVAAGVTGTLAYTSSRNLEDERNRQGANRPDLDRRSGEVRDLALATDILAGAAFVSAGITLVLTLSRGAPSATETSSLRIAPSLREVSLSGRF
jgi:hypothetical protein